MKKLLYFCMAGAILLFSIIVINISPSVNLGLTIWSRDSCSYYADYYNYEKKQDLAYFGNSEDAKKRKLYFDEKQKTKCERQKAMVGLEFAALNVNLVCGFVCAFLGFFFYFNIGEVGKISSFTGLGTGIIGFVLTFVYVIESGLVFNDTESTSRLRLDSDGAVLKYDSKATRYKCIYYKKDKYDSIYRRYSDYGNKYLNYYKDVTPQENNYKFEGCKLDSTYGRLTYSSSFTLTYDFCKSLDEDSSYNTQMFEYKNAQGNSFNCEKIYEGSTSTDNTYKVIYDRWLTTIILCCLIFLLDIGLAIFGFLNLSDSKGGI